MTNLFTEYSPYFLILCVLVGLAYTILLYTKDAPWSKWLNRILAGLRFLLVCLICFLLLNPFIRLIKNYFEKPIYVIALDNSQSLPLTNDTTAINALKQNLASIGDALKTQEFDIAIQTLSEAGSELNTPYEVKFDHPTTNLGNLLSTVQSNYENKNLAGVILVSDGIYNQGVSPTYTNYNMNIHTIGIGDTIPQSDLSLKAVYHNKIAYLGNKFPIVAEINNAGFLGRQTTVVLSQNGTIIETKTINFTKDNDLQQIQFLIDAKDKGINHYVVELKSLGGEFTTRNNNKHIYIDILDSKEKILLLASAPHPDVKAIRTAIEKNENYQIDVFIPDLMPAEQLKKNEKYDLIIFHQMPSKKGVIANNLLKEMIAKNTPSIFIIGSETNLQNFNNLQLGLTILASGFQTDKVTPSFSNSFNRFNFDAEKKSVIGRYPPITVPFGNYRLAANTEAILYQRVGSLVTEKPLIVVNDNNSKKTAIIIGEGLWQWRLQEYAKNENQEAFDEFFPKLVQYVSAKEDKRKFRVNTTATEYLSSESVLFETEAYNDIYEKIFGQKIDLQLTDERGKRTAYTYTNASEGFKYKINGLAQGIYQFKASTIIDGKQENVTGEFTIKELQMEALNTTADFNLLRQLSKQTGGIFVKSNNIQELKDRLQTLKAQSIIHSSEEVSELIHLKWLFFLLLGLVSVEWFVRKFRGSY
ncbi:MAG: VWA domain-containing protein [Thermoflexibacter sp.]|nr:VWA domain-containing protein [Thermoflexibacter sp.]